jgi:hypothetical protein
MINWPQQIQTDVSAFLHVPSSMQVACAWYIGVVGEGKYDEK